MLKTKRFLNKNIALPWTAEMIYCAVSIEDAG